MQANLPDRAHNPTPHHTSKPVNLSLYQQKDIQEHCARSMIPTLPRIGYRCGATIAKTVLDFRSVVTSPHIMEIDHVKEIKVPFNKV